MSAWSLKWRPLRAALVGLLATTLTVANEQTVLQPNDFPSAAPPPTITLQTLQEVLHTMQETYFTLWLGKYTTAIDWTSALTTTHLVAALDSLSRSTPYNVSISSSALDPNPNLNPSSHSTDQPPTPSPQTIDHDIETYTSHLLALYYTQPTFSLRLQAYDDMLWVSLSYLTTNSFLSSHSSRHHSSTSPHHQPSPWPPTQFLPSFTHRARIFYDLASQGWDTSLCSGGMLWSPRGLPYKNAVTNELFISASMGMYKGERDPNCEPFLREDCHTPPSTYLSNAVKAHTWLRDSGMRNGQGLYADGFHISGWGANHSRDVCDERDEGVWSYNQGILLGGLRGLWEVTGEEGYLLEGHELVRSVIKATHGGALGRGGILSERCDEGGWCNQDAQTFKGVFFHYLVEFCGEGEGVGEGGRKGGWEERGRERGGSDDTKKGQHERNAIIARHIHSCTSYTPFVQHNAHAALSTRDEKGRFGMWWGAPFTPINPSTSNPSLKEDKEDKKYDDPNARGRGRTLETQGSGVAVVRAGWEFGRLYPPSHHV